MVHLQHGLQFFFMSEPAYCSNGNNMKALLHLSLTWHMVLEAASVCQVAHTRHMLMALFSMAKHRLNRHNDRSDSAANHAAAHPAFAPLPHKFFSAQPPDFDKAPTRFCIAPFCCASTSDAAASPAVNGSSCKIARPQKLHPPSLSQPICTWMPRAFT